MTEVPNKALDAINSLEVHKEYSRSNLGGIFSIFVWLWYRIYLLIYTLIGTCKRLISFILTQSFVIRLTMSNILIAILSVLAIGTVFIRYRILTRYSVKTKTVNSVKIIGDNIDLVESTRKKRGGNENSASNYLDEFLRAIKIFGYLEGPVFNELTKNMTTQRLDENEILFLDERVGFSIVVGGTLQVYVKTNGSTSTADSVKFDTKFTPNEEIISLGEQRYKLLNEVKSGSPLTPLLSILELFKHQGSNFTNSTSRNSSTQLSPQSTGSFPRTEEFGQQGNLFSYPDIIARPKKVESKDSRTIVAIIPASSFRKIHLRFPKATSHLVSIVCTRLYKVTLSTIHSYIGLTEDIIRTEIELNSDSKAYVLRKDLIDEVARKFEDLQQKEERDAEYLDNISEYSNRDNTANGGYRNTFSSVGRSDYVVLNSRSKSTHPGDLLSSIPISKREDCVQNHSSQLPSIDLFGKGIEYDAPMDSFSSETSTAENKSSKDMQINIGVLEESKGSPEKETENESLKLAIIDNIFKILGLENDSWIYKPRESPEVTDYDPSLVGLRAMFEKSHGIKNSRSNSTESKFGDFNPLNSREFALENKTDKLYETINPTNASNSNSTKSSFSEEIRSRRGSKSKSLPEFTPEIIKAEFLKSLEIKKISPNTTVVDYNEFDTGLFYVIDGSLQVFIRNSEDEFNNKRDMPEHKIYEVQKGGVAGYLSTVVGLRSLVSIRTNSEQDAIVAYISKINFAKLMDKFYFLQLPVALKLKSQLPRRIIIIDFALEWCHIPAGDELSSQGDIANGFHIVLSGRFRAVRYKKLPKNGDEVSQEEKALSNDILSDNYNKHDQISKNYTVLDEYGHGESIGEVEVLTASRRTYSLIAVRDSEIARIPRNLFEMLSSENPSFMVKVTRIVAAKMASTQGSLTYGTNNNSLLISSSNDSYMSNNYKTITILPSVTGLPVREFSEKLVSAFKAIGRNVVELHQTTILNHLGRHAFDEKLAQLKLSGYFAYLEQVYETVVYVCDTTLKSNWTSTCISQGDCILLLADADDYTVATEVGEFEKLLMNLKTTARTDLCLIHKTRFVEPGSTSTWLKNRHWVHGHHHIQMQLSKQQKEANRTKRNIVKDLYDRIGSHTNPNIKAKIENVTGKAISSFSMINSKLASQSIAESKTIQMKPHKDDFLRLARILANEGVGLVLGGGGSRGISHVGVVMALERYGIPIDIIGGTSIGSLVGGIYARDFNTVSVYARTKQFAKRISSLWRMILDLTYPITSYTTGYEFNRGIWKIFGSYEIEDFWIRYFCNSTNITNSTMDVHESGYSWRFIRASMSLAGLLPPITYNGSMLLDGGYLDNLPVSEMKKKGAKYIIAVDVGSVDDRTPMNYGDTLSGFWVWLNKWNPFSSTPNIPNMMDIQLRLAYVASVNALEAAKKTPGVMYLRPPIEDYATLDFAKYDEIFNVGLAYAEAKFKEWETENTMPPIAGRYNKNTLSQNSRKSLYRRNSL